MKLFTSWRAQLISLLKYQSAFKNWEIFHVKIYSSSEEICGSDDAGLVFLHGKNVPGAEHHLSLCTSCHLLVFPVLAALWALESVSPDLLCAMLTWATLQDRPVCKMAHAQSSKRFLRTRAAFCVVCTDRAGLLNLIDQLNVYRIQEKVGLALCMSLLFCFIFLAFSVYHILPSACPWLENKKKLVLQLS